MAHWPAGTEARVGESVYRYERHRPEQTLLYQLVEQYYPAFEAELATQGKELPEYVQREFEDYLKCGRLEGGFMWHIPVPHPVGRPSVVQIGFPADLSCGFAVTPVMPNAWWGSVANGAAFAPAAGRGGWPRAPRCWWMKFFPNSLCVRSGTGMYRLRT